MTLTTGEIARHVQGELIGPADLPVSGINAMAAAQKGQLTFIRDKARQGDWASSQASAAFVGPQVDVQPGEGKAFIRVKNADVAVAQALELFAPPAVGPETGIHPSAVIHPQARIDASARIGPLCYVGRDVTVGARAVLHANVTVLDESSIGDDTVLYPGVIIRERCVIGRRCLFHANVSVGADGFGFRPSPDGRGIVKIPQIGGVIIHDDVELGAGTCVDRAKFDQTVIGQGTKIDNLCQIAHNCQVGRFCIIAGHVALGGSVVMGDGVMVGGGSIFKDQVRVGNGAGVAGGSMVMDDIPPGEKWGGQPAQDLRQTLREIAVIRKLPDILKQWRNKL